MNKKCPISRKLCMGKECICWQELAVSPPPNFIGEKKGTAHYGCSYFNIIMEDVR